MPHVVFASIQPAQKVVELNFALGDFDDTNIALMEEEAKKDEEEKEEGGEEDEEEEAQPICTGLPQVNSIGDQCYIQQNDYM